MVVRPVNNPCSPRELVACNVVCPVNNIRLTSSPRELVVPIFALRVVRPVNTLKELPRGSGFVFAPDSVDPDHGGPFWTQGPSCDRSQDATRTVERGGNGANQHRSKAATLPDSSRETVADRAAVSGASVRTQRIFGISEDSPPAIRPWSSDRRRRPADSVSKEYRVTANSCGAWCHAASRTADV